MSSQIDHLLTENRRFAPSPEFAAAAVATAELYAQALEHGGYTITRQYQSGQREVYLPELQGGKIDVFPEYSGNLLQYLDKNSSAKTGEEVPIAPRRELSGFRRVKVPHRGAEFFRKKWDLKQNLRHYWIVS